MDSTVSVITASHLSKKVSTGDGTLTILDDLSFTIDQGASVAVVGPSGSGKSTLLSLLAGLDLPSSGEVTLCNHNLTGLDEDGRARLRGENIGFVFQTFQLLPNLTALENVMLPLEVLGNTDPRSLAFAWMERVGLDHRLGHYPRQLSGGEQQRVAIARAFVTSPGILFADEPTGNLDKVTGQRIIELLFKLNREQGTTLVLITHDEQLADRCEVLLRLDGGQLVNNL